MSAQDKLFRRFPLIAATGIVMLTVAACAIQLDRHEEDQPPPPPEASETKDTLAPKLEACLTVTPEQTATFEYCRRVWAENRHRFFGPPKRTTVPKKVTQQAQPETAPPNEKDQSKLPQGNPTAASPAKE